MRSMLALVSTVTVTQSHSHIITQSHSLRFTHSHSHTVTHSQSHTVTNSHSHTVPQSQCPTVTQLHSDVVTQSYSACSEIFTQFHSLNNKWLGPVADIRSNINPVAYRSWELGALLNV